MKLIPLVYAALPLLLATGACNQASAVSGRSDAAASTAHEPIRLQGRVTDAANVLSSDAEKQLSDRLHAIEAATKHPVVIVTIPSLEGQEISAYTRSLGNRWGIGRKGHNDGLVILVAPRERKVRIAVGDGLTSRLSDADCSAIIQYLMLPKFREGDLAGGLQLAVDSLAATLS